MIGLSMGENMRHAMRRAKQGLSVEEIRRILTHGTYGVMALSGAPGKDAPCDNEPYAVPLNYVYVKDDPHGAEGAIYFHCAFVGRKMDLLRQNPKASFCVVAEHEVVPDEFATAYKSVIVFGNVDILDGADSYDELYALGERFNPGAHEAIEKEIASSGAACYVLRMNIDHMTGKQARMLVPSSSACVDSFG